MRLLILITKGIIRDRTVRRWVMFGVVIAALVMLFAGATFLGPFLMEHPFLFIAFWGGCMWLTLLAILLALYDLLTVRAQGRLERRRLRREIFGEKDDQD